MGDSEFMSIHILLIQSLSARTISEFRLMPLVRKWARFDVWDSAGNGAWLQPVAVH